MDNSADTLDPQIFDTILEHASRLSFDEIDRLECDEDVRAVLHAARTEVERRYDVEVLTDEIILIEEMGKVWLDAGNREHRDIFEKMNI